METESGPDSWSFHIGSEIATNGDRFDCWASSKSSVNIVIGVRKTGNIGNFDAIFVIRFQEQHWRASVCGRQCGFSPGIPARNSDCQASRPYRLLDGNRPRHNPQNSVATKDFLMNPIAERETSSLVISLTIKDGSDSSAEITGSYD